MSTVEVTKLSMVEGERRLAPPEMGQVSAAGGTFFVLVEVSAPTDVWDDASRQIVQNALETFKTSPLGETSALQAAAEAVNSWLLDQNRHLDDEDRIWAGFNAAFVRDDHLYLGQAGPALTYIARGEALTRFPKSFSDLQTERLEALAPLGHRPAVNCRMAHFQLAPDDRVVLAASHLPTLGDDDAIAAAIRREETQALLDGMMTLAEGSDFSSLVLTYEPSRRVGAAPAPAPAAKAAEAAAAPRSAPAPAPDRPEESRSARAARPQESPAPPAPAPAAPAPPPRQAPAPASEAPTGPLQPDRLPASRSAPPRGTPPPSHRASSPSASGRESGDSARPAARPPARALSSGSPPAGPTPATGAGQNRSEPRPAIREPRGRPVAAGVGAGRGGGRVGAGGVTAGREWEGWLKQAGAAALAIVAAVLAAVAALLTWLQEGLRPRIAALAPTLDRAMQRLWLLLRQMAHAGRRTLDQLLPGQRRARPMASPSLDPPGDGSAFLRGAVILLPLLLVAAAIAFGLGRGDGSGATTAAPPDEASALILSARQLIGEAQNLDEAAAQRLVDEALVKLAGAETLTDEPSATGEIAALRAQATALAGLASGVARPAMRTLATPGGGSPALLVVGANRVFTLETQLGAVYPVFPDQGEPVVLQPPTQPLLAAEQRGSGGVAVGTPIQLAWVPAGGGRSHDGLLIMTDNGQLWDYNPQSHQVNQIEIPLVTTVDRAAGYGGNLYILDRSSPQIWKYVPDAAGQYSQAPLPWLAASGRASLAAPADMAIDGFIYLLDGDGTVGRYQVGERRSDFELERVDRPLEGVVALAKRPPESSDLFLAGSRRILRYDTNGRFLVEYGPPPGSDWGVIQDIDIDAAGEQLYVLSNTGIHVVDLSGSRPEPAEGS